MTRTVQIIDLSSQSESLVEMDDAAFGSSNPTTEEIAENKKAVLRLERNTRLAETDWVVTMHKELGTNIPAAWKTYRQALRDITNTYSSLDTVVWPTKPTE